MYWLKFIKLSAGLMPTTMIDHIMKKFKLNNDYLNASKQLTYK